MSYNNILFVVLLYALTLINGQIIREYACQTDPKKVAFYGNSLTCPGNLICNSKYKLLPRETKPRPCIAPTEICEFSCDPKNDENVNIYGNVFRCDSTKRCNKEKTSCEICVAKPCSKTAFSCLPSGKVQFTGGLEMDCGPGMVCNKDYAQPCAPCIRTPTTPSTGRAVRSLNYSGLLLQSYYS